MTNQMTGGRSVDAVRAWATREGVFIGPEIALIRRNRHRGGQPFEVRPNGVIDAALSRLWGREIELRRHADALNGAMLALNRGDLALAKQIARGIALPPVPESLRKEWEESKHPRHPAGTPEGGEFAPTNGEGSGAPSQVADASATQVAAAPKPRQVPPPVSETAPGVDWSFIQNNEGTKPNGYVPIDKNGNVRDRSGVTVATGVDLGQHGVREINNLDIPEELKAKLREYAGMRGQPALDFLAANPLTLSPQEVASLDDAVCRQKALEFTQNYDTEATKTPGALRFRDLPPEAQTAIMSYAFQNGQNFRDKSGPDKSPVSHKDVWDAATSQDWNRLHSALTRIQDGYERRRAREAAQRAPLLR